MTFSKSLTACLCICLSLCISAQDFEIEHYDVAIQLKDDGSFDVTENIDVNFSKRMRGIFRTITTNRDVGEQTQIVSITNIKTGNINRKITKRRNEVEIRLGSADKYIKGPQSYSISYTVKNGITPYDGHDEFYWSLMGNQWKETIKAASFSIELPTDLELSPLDIAAFTDTRSSAQHANIQYKDRIIRGSSRDELGDGQGLTVAFKTPKGYFSALDYNTILTKKSNSSASINRQQEPAKVYPRDFGFPLPVLLIGGLLYFFNLKGRNKKSEELGASYFPPEDLNPPEIGVFHDFQVNKRDLISLIPYWGEQGYLKVASITKDDGSVDMRFEKQKDLSMDHPSYEKEFFDSIFKTGNTVYLHELENEMYQSFSSVGKALKTEVLDMKLYDQEAKKTFHSGRFILLGIISLICAIAVAIIFHAIASAAFLVIFSFVCFYVHLSKPKKNARGQRLHAHLNALKRTLENPDPAELNRIIKNDPQYLDKVFPYVVALGLDDTWSSHVSPIFNTAPDWYYGDDMTMRPDFHSFNQGFSTSRIGKTMTSSPVADSSSSAFGGSGGGGFSGSSGGGFGGGGGGGGW